MTSKDYEIRLKKSFLTIEIIKKIRFAGCERSECQKNRQLVINKEI